MDIFILMGMIVATIALVQHNKRKQLKLQEQERSNDVR